MGITSSLDYILNYCQTLVQCRLKNMFQREYLTRSSNVIYFTKKEGQRHDLFVCRVQNRLTPSTSTELPNARREDYRSCALPFYTLVQTLPEALHPD